MSLYYLILWNQVDILQKHFKKDHVRMRLWTRFYGKTRIPLPQLWNSVYADYAPRQTRMGVNIFHPKGGTGHGDILNKSPVWVIRKSGRGRESL